MFAGTAFKLEKVGHVFQVSVHVHPLRQTTGNISIPKYSLKYQNWTIIFGIQLM